MRILAPLLFAACLAACAVPGLREPDRYFLLEAAEPPASPLRTRQSIVVAPMSAGSFYDTQDIAYSRAPGTRAYYRFNHWTERPQRRIEAQLVSRLEGDGSTPAWSLRAHLEEIYHDAREQPGTARITIKAELVDAAGAVAARRTFAHYAPAASYDAAGAVLGFNRALSALISEVEGWVAAEAGPISKRK